MVRGRNNTGPAPCAPPSIGGHPSHAAVARRSRISTSPPPRPRQGPSRRSPQPQRAAARARLGGHALPGANGPHAASAQRSRSRSPLRLGALRRSPHLHTAKRNRAQCDCGLRLQPAFLAPLSGTSAPAALGQSPCSPWPQSAVATPPAPRVRWPGAGPPRAAIAGCTLHSYLTGSTGHAPHSCAARCLHVVGFAANEPMCRSQWRAKMSGRDSG